MFSNAFVHMQHIRCQTARKTESTLIHPFIHSVGQTAEKTLGSRRITRSNYCKPSKSGQKCHNVVEPVGAGGSAVPGEVL